MIEKEEIRIADGSRANEVDRTRLNDERRCLENDKERVLDTKKEVDEKLMRQDRRTGQDEERIY